MDAAGAALGGALDGIQDFDWQNVRDFVESVTGARKSAEIGALTAQVGFVSSYYSSLNSYTGSIASASVTHATGYLAEDYAFCHRARLSGLPLVADTTIRLWHIGDYGYSWEDAGIDRPRFADFDYRFEG